MQGILIRHLLRELRKCHLLLLREGSKTLKFPPMGACSSRYYVQIRREEQAPPLRKGDDFRAYFFAQNIAISL